MQPSARQMGLRDQIVGRLLWQGPAALATRHPDTGRRAGRTHRSPGAMLPTDTLLRFRDARAIISRRRRAPVVPARPSTALGGRPGHLHPLAPAHHPDLGRAPLQLRRGPRLRQPRNAQPDGSPPDGDTTTTKIMYIKTALIYPRAFGQSRPHSGHPSTVFSRLARRPGGAAPAYGPSRPPWPDRGRRTSTPTSPARRRCPRHDAHTV